MKAIILAAGQGMRLKKYAENIPKGMLEFQGRTIIERQLEMYHKCGISDISIVTGYASEKIKYESVKYYKNKDYASTNMVESLMAANEEFNDDVIVSYSDILFDEFMLREMILSEGDCVCAVDINWKAYWLARYGRVDFDIESLSLDKENNIVELGLENPKIEDIDARYVGLIKFSGSCLTLIQYILERDYYKYKGRSWKQSGKTIKKAYMTDLLQAIIEEGQQVVAAKFMNGWIEFDTNEDYEITLKWANEGTLDRFLNL